MLKAEGSSLGRRLLSYTPRSLLAKLLVLSAAISVLLTLHSFFPASFSLYPSSLITSPRFRSTCPPRAWADGQWTPKAPPTNRTEMSQSADALEFMGFQGCASDREYYWHLAADSERLWDRFPSVTSWEWTPADGCEVRPLEPAAMVKDMVEQGGWLLIGDSVTENHFFSLSCLLYPHVRATPNYTENPYFDRAWPQHLYLSPSSPLLPTLALPPDFNISSTPLVTFRRVDLLLAQPQLEALYHTLRPNASAPLFSEEQFWSLAPEEYMALFDAPGARYGTLVVSTAGHWTTTLLAGFQDEGGIEGVLEFFRAAMARWADEVQRAMDASARAAGRRGRRRQVIVRAYLPGHEDCHDERAPWTEWHPFRWNWYNWASIGDFNAVFENVTKEGEYPDIHFLPIDRPALLRPDAHSSGDCLHIMSGAGVLEGWSHYIWHYVTREIPGRIR